MRVASGTWRRIALAMVMAVLFGRQAQAAPPLDVCGNGVVDAGEECDDGGVCVGGANAGTACTADTQCLGDGVCAGGPMEDNGCSTDAQCPGGRCVRCRSFGGDGCAANCTTETDVPFNLVPGVQTAGNVLPGTSGSVIHLSGFTIPLPLTGSEVFTIGKERNGQMPFVVKAASVAFPPIRISNVVCACVRGFTVKTCGGTILDSDGTRSMDCTADDNACLGKNPCMFVHGSGNSAAGVVGCGGLSDTDLSVTDECGALNDPPQPPVDSTSGIGAPGAAHIIFSTALTVAIPSTSGPDVCVGTDPAFGPDGAFCTDDDPQTSLALSVTLPATTGTATALVTNASDTAGFDIGPFSTAGAPFSCSALTNGTAIGCLASAFTGCSEPTVGDVILTGVLCASGPVPTPMATPTPLPVLPLIRGDHRDPAHGTSGCQVEWQVTSAQTALDRFGLPSERQVCDDADPACDFQMNAAGLCEFHVRVCLNDLDPGLPRCVPNGVSAVEISQVRGSPLRLPAVRQVIAADAAALHEALQHLMDPQNPGAGFVYAPPLQATQRNLCSAPFPVQILTGGMRRGTVVLKVRSRNDATPAHKELSKLSLTCKSRRLP